MKHNYLLVAALATSLLSSITAQAQWAEPEAPTRPVLSYEGATTELENGGRYYLYNVGAGQFLGGGQTWGTRGIVLLDSLVTLDQPTAQINTVSSNTTANYILPFELTQTEDQTAWYIKHLNTSKASSGNEWFVGENGAQAWIDGDAGRQASFGMWEITPVEGGYQIANIIQTGVALGVDGNNLAGITWAHTWTDLAVEQAEGSTILPWIVWQLVSVDDSLAIRDYVAECLPKLEAYQAQLEVYNARVELYQALTATLDLSFTIDTKEATYVYEDPEATVEMLNEAVAAVAAAIHRAQWEADWANATDDAPLDVTEYCLVNPAFEDGNISGWECTYQIGVSATNIGYQGSSYTNGDVTISHFIEAWQSNTSPYVVGDGFLRQTVYGLPEGKYVLEADVNAVYQWTNEAGSNPVKGVYLYIQAGDVEAKAEVSSGNGLPEHFSVTYIHDGSASVTFGLKTESATANWIAADNFTIRYYGKTNQTIAQAALAETIKSAEELAATFDDIKAYAETKQALLDAISAASKTLASGTDDETELGNARTAVNQAIADLNASIAAYQRLGQFIDENSGDLTHYLDIIAVNTNWDELSAQLEELQETLSAQYQEGSITSDEIDQAIASVPQLIRDYITIDNIEPGNDLTLLLVNADFSEGSGATDIPGWTINSGQLTELSASYHNIEAFHRYFDFSQTVKDMPAGIYSIGVQGFVRVDNSADNASYPNVGDQNNMVLYAGESTNRFKLLTEEYSETALLSDAGDGTSGGAWPYDTPHNDIVIGSTVYVPNSMEGAKAYFDTTNPLTGLPFYYNNVKIVHRGGDLTIGVRCDAGNLWILWDNFTIKYEGQDLDIYLRMIDEENEVLQDIVARAEGAISEQGNTMLSAVQTKIDDKDNIVDHNEALNLLAEMRDVETYITEGIKLAQTLKATVDLYNSVILLEYNSSDDHFMEVLSEAENLTFDGSLAANNEAFTAANEAIYAAWPGYIFADVDEEPVEEADVTGVIFNPNYTLWGTVTGSADYWTIQNVGGNNYAASYSELECYNNDSINVSQTLSGLKEGYYRVGVQGFYRPCFPEQYTDSLATVQNAYIYATSSVHEMTAHMLNAVQDGQKATTEGSIGVGTESEITVSQLGESFTTENILIPNNMEAAQAYFSIDKYHNSVLVKVGEDGKLTIGVAKVAHNNGDWTIFTNWTLHYLGKTGMNSDDALAVSGIVAGTNAPAAFFGIDGTRAASLRRGINIVRLGNGTIQKVLVK